LNVQVWVVVWLSPFVKSKAILETNACPINHGSKRRVMIVDVPLGIAHFVEIP
jgi:hypothetical protein